MKSYFQLLHFTIVWFIVFRVSLSLCLTLLLLSISLLYSYVLYSPRYTCNKNFFLSILKESLFHGLTFHMLIGLLMFPHTVLSLVVIVFLDITLFVGLLRNRLLYPILVQSLSIVLSQM